MNKDFEISKILSTIAGFGLVSYSIFSTAHITKQEEVDELINRFQQLDVNFSVSSSREIKSLISHFVFVEFLSVIVFIISFFLIILAIYFAIKGHGSGK